MTIFCVIPEIRLERIIWDPGLVIPEIRLERIIWDPGLVIPEIRPTGGLSGTWHFIK
jgi:hypothetical protein